MIYYDIVGKKKIKKKQVKNHGKRNSTFGKNTTLIILLAVLLGVILLVSYFLNNKKEDKLTCANEISCIDNLSGDYDHTKTYGTYMGKVIKSPDQIVQNLESSNQVLGETSSEKRIEIDLSTQRLRAFEGSKLVYEFPVSTGKWYETPTGIFNIWVKLRYTRMTGGNKDWGTYYDLPNVPYTMFFYNNEIPKYVGYGIHGAYWHNNFGHPMSHGCVNMKTEDVEKIYYWADPPTTGWSNYGTGTQVVIFGKTPSA